MTSLAKAPMIKSRVGRKPVQIPAGVEFSFVDCVIKVKGPKGSLEQRVSPEVNVEVDQGNAHFRLNTQTAYASMQAGTARALLSSMIQGVSKGYEQKLVLVGVGFRVQIQGSKVSLVIGYSHPVEYQLPEGVTAEAPSVTELVLKGINKQLLGQVAAEIRAFRPPEVYKGKGIRYAAEKISLKEAKKK